MVKATSIDPEATIDEAIRFAANSGGLFIDMAVHDIDLIHWFLNDATPTQVHAMGGSFVHKAFDDYDDGDNVLAMVAFEENKMAMMHSGRNAAHGYHIETEIIGPKGSIRIGSVPQKNLVEVLDSSGVRKECSQSFQERFNEAYRLEMEDFINCILDPTRKPKSKVEDGTKVTRLAFAATEAFKTNTIIKL
jgi:myo-inositol 2-dehydrogenase/D-chiro-inositol 1-dehydrogenase